MRARLVRPVSTALTALTASTASTALLHAQATDPTGHWRTLETTHFRVHTRAAWREVGVRAAVQAESAYAALANLLPPPRRRIDLVVADHFDLSNGFATTYPLPRVVIYAAPPAGDVQLAYYDRWLRLVITHELAHVFHLDPARGWWGVARAVFGRAPPLFPNLYSPTWLTEGLAVFYESRLTQGGRLDGGLHDAVVRAHNAERGLLPVDAAGGLSPRWPAGTRPYAFGSAFFAALAHDHGDTAVARLVRAQSSRLLPFVQLPQAVRIATGSGFRRAWAQGQPGVMDVVQGGGTRAGDARILLSRQRSFVAARVGPAGRVLAVDDDGRDAPRLILIDSGIQRSLGRVNHVTGLAWDTGGAALVSQLEFTRATEVRSDLWRVTLDGRATRLTRGERLLEPDVAPDGAIVAVRLVPGGNELVVIERGETRAIGAAGGVEWAQPRFAPDGRAIAAVRVRDGAHDIVVLDRDGATIRELTADGVVDRMPVFADGGRTVMWSREGPGGAAIVAAPAAAGEAYMVRRAPFAAFFPEPDGDSLLYLSYHADGLRLVKAARGDLGALGPSGFRFGGGGGPSPPDTGSVRAEHRYRPWPAILPQYWLPIGSSELGASFFGVFSSSADALGRHAWVASAEIGGGIAAGSWRGHLGYAYARFSPLLLDAFYERDQLVYTVVPPGGGPAGPLQCCIADESVQLGASLVRRRWRSSLAARGAVEYDRTGSAERWGLAGAASLATAVRPAFGVSLQQGVRATASVRHRWRPGLDRNSTEYVARLSWYHRWPTGGFARQVTGLRLAAGTITGSDNLLRFAVGGANEESAVLLPGIVIGGGARTFPLRGANPGEYAGRHAASVSLEHRVPLALVGRGLPWLLPAGLDRLSVSAFGDGVLASTAGQDDAYGATGLELVADLGVGADFPLRARLGFAQRVDVNQRNLYVAVGSSF